MALIDRFTDPVEDALGRAFLADGYVIREVADRPALYAMRREIVRLACQHLGCDLPADDGDFLNRNHQRVAVSAVNALRLHVFTGLNPQPCARATSLALGRTVLHAVV